MTSHTVLSLLKSEAKSQDIEIQDCVRTFRANRFIALNDGSTLQNIQCVVDYENTDETTLTRITTGGAVNIKGLLIESQGKGQNVDIQENSNEFLGDSDPETYPFQPKQHSLEFL